MNSYKISASVDSLLPCIRIIIPHNVVLSSKKPQYVVFFCKIFVFVFLSGTYKKQVFFLLKIVGF
jgi:hypothetical protein